MSNATGTELVAVDFRAALEHEVAKALLIMAKTLANPKPVDAELVQIWAALLVEEGIRPEEVVPAAQRITRSERFFPTPADFIAAARPQADPEAQSELAWQRVKTAISRFGGNASLMADDLGGDGAALFAVERLGWPELCAELDVKNENLKRASFVRLYQMAVREGQALDRLRGAFERENELRNRDLDPALCGRPDWKTLPVGPGDPEEFQPIAPGVLRALAQKMLMPAAESEGVRE